MAFWVQNARGVAVNLLNPDHPGPSPRPLEPEPTQSAPRRVAAMPPPPLALPTPPWAIHDHLIKSPTSDECVYLSDTRRESITQAPMLSPLFAADPAWSASCVVSPTLTDDGDPYAAWPAPTSPSQAAPQRSVAFSKRPATKTSRKTSGHSSNGGSSLTSTARSDSGSSTQSSSTSTSKRRYTCTVPGCERSFTTSGHLHRHEKCVHGTEKPFACPHPSCTARFSRNDNCQQHYKTHFAPRRAWRPGMTVPRTPSIPVSHDPGADSCHALPSMFPAPATMV